MDVIVPAIELHQLRLEVRAYAGKDDLHRLKVILLEHVAPIFGHEDQMYVQGKYAVSSVP